MARVPEYKKRCRKCLYSTIIHGIKYEPNLVACYYMGITNERRGCPASECDKFEPKRRGRKKKTFNPI